MEIQWIALLITIPIIAFFVIRNKIRYKHSKRELPIMVYKYKYIKYIFPTASREHWISQKINEIRLTEIPLSEALLSDLTIHKECIVRVESIDKQNKASHTGAVDSFIRLRTIGSDSAGEILCYGYQDPTKAWWKSPSHKKAMLNPQYDYFSVKSKKDEHGRWIDLAIFVDEKTKGIINKNEMI